MLDLHTKNIVSLNNLKQYNYFHIENKDVVYLKQFKFAYFNFYEDEILDYQPEVMIDVPSNWQILGYDNHQYTNIKYPFPLNPPFIDKDNPCGLYVTNYKVEDLKKKHYLNIDGADSCLYLFVNHQFVGYQTISHSNNAYDISKYLQIGDNEIRMIVFKWNYFSYLDDQDKFRMSGIFGDVYVSRRPKNHLKTFKINTDIKNKDGILTFECDKKCVVTFNGITTSSNKATFKVKDVKLWSAERPSLYDLIIKCNGETIKESVGFRKITIKGNVLLLNGKPIKFKGVNRHSSTINGYVETVDDLIKDIKILKSHNINAIRTSHYPPHKELPYLCDKFGIYLLEEADVECHGVVFKDGYYNDDYYNDFANSPLFEKGIVARNQKMVLRDLNRASIVMWSLGNESGWGKAFIKASLAIRKIDNTRPIHYERTWIGSSIYKKGQDRFGFANDCKKYVDVYSRMYPEIEYMKKIKNKLDKPFILCEYSHAMGNSCGDLQDYDDLIESSNCYCGGFIWELINHSVLKDGKYLYGGDFNEYPHDFNFCMDGLVGIDRVLFPEIEDVKNIFSRIKIKQIDKTHYQIDNRFAFISLDDYKCNCFQEIDGKAISFDEIDIKDINPLSSRKFKINLKESDNLSSTINFDIIDKDNNIVSHSNFIINNPKYEFKDIKSKINQIGYQYEINGYKINHYGMIYDYNNKMLFKEPVRFEVCRAYIDNDMHQKNRWNNIDLNNTKFFVHNQYIKDDVLYFKGSLNSRTNHIAEVLLSYKAIEKGIKVKMDVDVDKHIDYLPRFGMSFTLLNDYNKASYLGFGPNESYCDKHQASHFGRFNFDVFDNHNYFNYPKPQESASHFNSFEAKLQSSYNELLIKSNNSFSFQAIPFKVNEFEDHSYKMNYDSKHTIVNIDYKMSGVGSNSCGPRLAKKYQLDEKKFSFEFALYVKR